MNIRSFLLIATLLGLGTSHLAADHGGHGGFLAGVAVGTMLSPIYWGAEPYYYGPYPYDGYPYTRDADAYDENRCWRCGHHRWCCDNDGDDLP